jgi:hypothetical protein
MKKLHVISLVAGFLTLLLVGCASYQLDPKTANAAELLPSPQVSVVNGVSIDAGNYRVEDGFFVADICYDRPTDEDWLLAHDMSIEFDGKSVTVFEWGLIDFESRANGVDRRCDFARFPIGEGVEVASFRLVIPRIETSFPDSPNCETAQKVLDASATGIIIRCIQEEGLNGPELVSKPDNLSEDEAYKLIREAFIGIVRGPWIIEGSTKR